MAVTETFLEIFTRWNLPCPLNTFVLLGCVLKLLSFLLQLVVFARKLTIILIVTRLSSYDEQLQVALGMLVVLLYLQEHARPFASPDGEEASTEKERENDRENDRLHLVESSSLLILILMVWSAGFFGVSECGKDNFGCSALGVLVIASNVVYMCACALVMVRAFSVRNKKYVKKRMNKLSGKLSEVKHLIITSSMRSKPSSSGMTEAERRTTAFHEKMFPTERVSDAAVALGEGAMKNNPLGRGRSRSQFARSADWMEAAEVEMTVRENKKEEKVVRSFERYETDDGDEFFVEVGTEESVWDLPEDGKVVEQKD